MLDLSIPTCTRINEAYVHDGKGGSCPVHVGNQVDLLNFDDEFMQRWLEPGPYTVTWLGRWRCNRECCGLKTSGGDNSGGPTVNASYLKIHEETIAPNTG
jgi:hypothetical protein